MKFEKSAAIYWKPAIKPFSDRRPTIMQMLYNSENFAVVRFELETGHDAVARVPAQSVVPDQSRGGYEIVDKTVRREIFIEGALAERFRRGVQELVDTGEATEESFDAYIAGFADFAQQPVVLH